MKRDIQKGPGASSQANAAASLSKSYEPHAIETRLYEHWERSGYFSPAGSGEPYCIMIPPPNVTGSLHMGHAFQDTLMDTLVRYHRMRGDNTLWQVGTDHAGIATQMVVERQLNAEGKTRHDLGREQFIARVWDWKAHSGGTITRQLRRMGASVDWTRERFTMDEGLSHAVTEVFVRLYEEGLVYRGKRLVNWDPVLHTAVSDLEVMSEEEAGHLWHIRYPIQGTKEFLVVATTRPETMLGDSAVAVHPDDDRYRHLIGKQVELPLTGRTIPVVADEYVDREFGSGCVKITPAHDFNDYEVGRRHDLPLINIFTVDAKIDLPGSPYHGLDRYDARKRIIADLEAKGLMERIQDHKLMVPRGDRTNAVIEPFLTDQWYVKVAPLAAEATKAVEDGRIRFVPESWAKTYYEWMRNIQDWCISRQIWWGHRIPAWYDDAGAVYVGRSETEVRKKHGLADRPLRQDDDVLDTWFSSALWPFSTLGWPEQTPELKTFYPSSVLVTGFDIIFFWVARMIMMGLKFTGEVPFREVYVHGLVRDAEGQKMSKSKGNVLDPLDIIDGIDLESLVAKRTREVMQPHLRERIERLTRKNFANGIPAFGTDTLRFTFASVATQGRDVRFDVGRLEGYRNFCNKLWNAARYVLMNTEGKDCGLGTGSVEYTVIDRWILSRLQETVAEVDGAFAEYRFDLAGQSIYNLIWYSYCDWYLELSKVVLNDSASSAALLRGTRQTLVVVLEATLRLLHPIMPFITEELWYRVAPLAGKSGATIMRQAFPRSTDYAFDADAVREARWVMAMIETVRNIRGERDIPPGKPLPMMLQDGSEREKNYLERNRRYLTTLARLSSITWLEAGEQAPESAIGLVDLMKVLIPLGSIINKVDELARLKKEIVRLEKELIKATGKLANADFVARAPAEIVAQEKQRVSEFEAALAKFRTQCAQVEALPE